MAGVEVQDIKNILAYPVMHVEESIKYKVTVTVMGLRFFLKDYKPEV